MPKALTCYICGRGFMKSSIGIHLEKCGKKFKAESANYGIKRKVPERPAKLDEVSLTFHQCRFSRCLLFLREFLTSTMELPRVSIMNVV